MTARPVFAAALLALIIAGPSALAAQDTTKPKPDSARAGMMMMEDHMLGPWKEMNAFHRVMAATWHPAAQKNDVAPLKAKSKELLSSAESWLASKPPAMPASCASEAVRTAVTKVVNETRAVLALVESGADDAKLKAGLKNVHDAFEVAEKGCAGHGGHGGAR